MCCITTPLIVLFQGLVLLTEDARLSSSPNGITKEFAALCHRSTEYHFPTFEQQVETTKRDHLQPGTRHIPNFSTELSIGLERQMGVLHNPKRRDITFMLSL